MKKFLFMALVLIAGCVTMVSCSKDDEPKESYDFIGTYHGDETDFLSILVINADKTFSHTNDYTPDGKEEWTGVWSYDDESNIITLHYLVEKVTHSDDSVETEYLDNDYCWAQPYNNGKNLRYKEYWDDEWEDYSGWVKVSK